MATRVIISRRVPEVAVDLLKPLLLKLRSLALTQDGYVSGETLVNARDRSDFVVLSTWRSVEDWDAWLANPIRQQVESQVEQLLGQSTVQNAYCHG